MNNLFISLSSINPVFVIDPLGTINVCGYIITSSMSMVGFKTKTERFSENEKYMIKRSEF